MKYLKKETIKRMALNIPDKDKKIAELIDFVNKWAKERYNERCREGNTITEFGQGYREGIKDIMDLAMKLDLDVIWAAQNDMTWITDAEARKLKYWVLENMVVKQ